MQIITNIDHEFETDQADTYNYTVVTPGIYTIVTDTTLSQIDPDFTVTIAQNGIGVSNQTPMTGQTRIMLNNSFNCAVNDVLSVTLTPGNNSGDIQTDENAFSSQIFIKQGV